MPSVSASNWKRRAAAARGNDRDRRACPGLCQARPSGRFRRSERRGDDGKAVTRQRHGRCETRSSCCQATPRPGKSAQGIPPAACRTRTGPSRPREEGRPCWVLQISPRMTLAHCSLATRAQLRSSPTSLRAAATLLATHDPQLSSIDPTDRELATPPDIRIASKPNNARNSEPGRGIDVPDESRIWNARLPVGSEDQGSPSTNR